MEFAHNKPVKSGSKKDGKVSEELVKEKLFKTLIEKILDFNNLYKK